MKVVQLYCWNYTPPPSPQSISNEPAGGVPQVRMSLNQPIKETEKRIQKVIEGVSISESLGSRSYLFSCY